MLTNQITRNDFPVLKILVLTNFKKNIAVFCSLFEGKGICYDFFFLVKEFVLFHSDAYRAFFFPPYHLFVSIGTTTY